MCCGFYCRQDSLSRTQSLRLLGGCGAPGNRQDRAVVRSSRSLRVQLLARLPVGVSRFTALATVNPTTDLAPASSNALAHASSVAPVVITSSTSKTRLLSTWLPGRVAKAPRTMRQRSSLLSMCLSGRALVRMSKTGLRGRPAVSASVSAISSAWLNPRSRSRFGGAAPARRCPAQAIAPCDRGDLLREVRRQRINPLELQQDDRAYQHPRYVA